MNHALKYPKMLSKTNIAINTLLEKVNKLGLSKIKLFSPGRIGRVAALNYGISIASGDYVSILDADDIFDSREVLILLAEGASSKKPKP